MRGLLLLLVHVLTVLARLAGPGGVRGLVAENVLLKQQLLILDRTRRRARKLSSFREYFNESRVHCSLGGKTPGEMSNDSERCKTALRNYRWEQHCSGLVTLPVAA